MANGGNVFGESFYRRIMDELYLPLNKIWYDQETSDRYNKILYPDAPIPPFYAWRDSIQKCREEKGYSDMKNKETIIRSTNGIL